MAKVTQVGPGRKTTGTIDGITYVTRNGVTYARSAPTMPASAYNTPAAKLRQAIFKMIQMHLKFHLRTIKQTFTPKGNGSASNRYYSLNGKALSKALEALADLNVIFSFCREINGEKKNFCLVTNPRKKLKYRMFTEAES